MFKNSSWSNSQKIISSLLLLSNLTLWEFFCISIHAMLNEILMLQAYDELMKRVAILEEKANKVSRIKIRHKTKCYRFRNLFSRWVLSAVAAIPLHRQSLPLRLPLPLLLLLSVCPLLNRPLLSQSLHPSPNLHLRPCNSLCLHRPQLQTSLNLPLFLLLNLLLLNDPCLTESPLCPWMQQPASFWVVSRLSMTNVVYRLVVVKFVLQGPLFNSTSLW